MDIMNHQNRMWADKYAPFFKVMNMNTDLNFKKCI